jgi:NADH-quinone oxidoreductase subunit H
MHNYLYINFINLLIKSGLTLIFIVPTLIICIAIYTYLERKGLASIQKRKGPNRVGFLGLLQPFADGVKLLLKEHNFPSRADKLIFFISPILAFLFSLAS